MLRPLRTTVFASIVACLGYILVHAFEWTLLAHLGFFAAPLVLNAAKWLLVATVVWSVLYAMRRINTLRLALLLPAANLAVLLGVPHLPWTPLWLERNFISKFSGRMQVVELVESGVISGGRRLLDEGEKEYELIELPENQRHLSVGGQIMVERSDSATAVFFFTFQGLMNNFSGYVYRSNDRPPSRSAFGGYYHELERKQERWFWAASW